MAQEPSLIHGRRNVVLTPNHVEFRRLWEAVVSEARLWGPYSCALMRRCMAEARWVHVRPELWSLVGLWDWAVAGMTKTLLSGTPDFACMGCFWCLVFWGSVDFLWSSLGCPARS